MLHVWTRESDIYECPAESLQGRGIESACYEMLCLVCLLCVAESLFLIKTHNFVTVVNANAIHAVVHVEPSDTVLLQVVFLRHS